jgi:hypothetical protein
MKIRIFLLDAAHRTLTYFMMFLMTTVNIQRPIAITASMTVLSSPLFAQTSDSLLLDSLVQKYDLNNPQRNHQEGGITPEMQKALDNRQHNDLTQVLSDSINSRGASKTYDFSGYTLDTADSISNANGMANNIGKSHGSPQEGAGEVRVEYTKKGTRKFSHDANGKLIMSAVSGGERVLGVGIGNVVGSEINNTEHNFQADTMHGDNDGILKEGAKANVSLKSGKTGSARAYQDITNTMNKAMNTRVDDDAAWLSNTWNRLDETESNQGDFFQACTDIVTSETQEFKSESSRIYHCQDLTKSSLDYCDVERIVRVPVLSVSPGLRGCGLGCFEFDLHVDTWKTSRCRETWAAHDPVDPATFKLMLNTEEYDLVNVNLKGRAWDHFKVSVNGESIWASQGRPDRQGTTGNWGSKCNPDGGSNGQGNMDVNVTDSVKAAIGTGGGIQEIDFLGELKWKRTGGMDIVVQLMVEDKTGRGLESEYIQTPAGCYDALNEDARAANPLEGVYSPEEILGITNDPYVSRAFCTSPVEKPTCKAGETLFGNVTQEVCLTNARPIQKYCSRGIMDVTQTHCDEDAKSTTTTTPPITTTLSCPFGGNLIGSKCRIPVSYVPRCNADQDFRGNMIVRGVRKDRCSRSPTSSTSRSWSCTNGQTFDSSSCNVEPENYQTETGGLIQTVDSNGFPVTPYDNEGSLITFKDTAVCTTTHTIEVEEEPVSFCVFDGYEIMEEGPGDHHPSVLSVIPDFFAGDTGDKTWKVNLEGYKCNPTYADIVGLERYTGEEVTYTWEEIRELDNHCQVYIDDANCSEIGRSCSMGWLEKQTDRCIADTVDYECITETALDFELETTSNVCEASIPCAGGNCEFGENEANGRFVEAMVQASVLQGVEGDRSCEVHDDPTTCRVFEGEYEYCSWDVTGMGGDCCEEPAGLNVMSYVTAALATQRVNAMTGQGTFTTTVLGEVATGAWDIMADTVVGEGMEAAWNTTSTAFTSATESLFGTGAGAGASATTSAVNAAIAELQQMVLKMVYDALPEELAKMIITETAANEATNQAADYALNGVMSNVVGMVAGAYAIYTWVKLIVSLLTACDDSEIDMGTKLGQRQCVKFGESYCSKEVAGLCYQKRKDHCCYSSILSRIIMEQALPQLNKPFDKNCEGLTQEELGSLDFSQIDLSEWQTLLIESGEVPTETNEQSLTGGGEMVDTHCEYTETYDPITETMIVEEDCYGTLENGRIINAEERQTVSERTLERTNSINGASKAAENSALDKINNLDCSEIPRPAVCTFGFDPRDDIE